MLERWGRRQQIPAQAPALMIVAGCAVLPSGQPSPALARRVLTAIRLPFPDTPLLLTGGGQPVSEATAAAGLARQQGVSEDRLLLEHHASSTEENAVFAARLVRQQGGDPRQMRVLVISDSVHLYRCFLVFRREFGTVQTFPTPGPVRWRLSLREVVVLVGYWIQGKLG
jgi:uncharacterized SAM-binding protein YcdF (DUF218 family)